MDMPIPATTRTPTILTNLFVDANTTLLEMNVTFAVQDTIRGPGNRVNTTRSSIANVSQIID